MLTLPTTRTAVLLAALVSGVAGAECRLETPTLSPLAYSATRQAEGRLNLAVTCDSTDQLRQYTLKVSAPAGRFDQASGAYLMGAVGKAGSVLQLQIVGASPALGGTVAPTVYTGSQSFEFRVLVPPGQWQASGRPVVNLNIELTPFATGTTQP